MQIFLLPYWIFFFKQRKRAKLAGTQLMLFFFKPAIALLSHHFVSLHQLYLLWWVLWYNRKEPVHMNLTPNLFLAPFTGNRGLECACMSVLAQSKVTMDRPGEFVGGRQCFGLCTSVHGWYIEFYFVIQNFHLVCHPEAQFFKLVDRKLHSSDAQSLSYNRFTHIATRMYFRYSSSVLVTLLTRHKFGQRIIMTLWIIGPKGILGCTD